MKKSCSRSTNLLPHRTALYPKKRGNLIMRYRSRRFKISLIVLVFWFVLIPLGVSMFYGNIPFLNRYYGTYSNSSGYGNSSLNGQNMANYSQYPYGYNYSNNSGFTRNYGLNSNVSGNMSSLSSYIARTQMTFWHVFRDMFIIFMAAVAAVIWYHFYGSRLFRSIRRRF